MAERAVGWEAVDVGDNDLFIHVVPMYDKQPHLTAGCPCNPELIVFESGNAQVIHNALDGRELFEVEIIRDN